MTTRWRVAGALAGVLLVAFAWSSLRHWGEPRYKGQSVEYWLLEYCRSSPEMHYDLAARKEAETAFSNFGAKAVPYLLRVSFMPADSKARQHWNEIQNSFLGLLGKPGNPGTLLMQQQALNILRDIKAPASVVLPLIESNLNSTNLYNHREALILSGTVGEGGEKAICYLTNALLDSDVWTRGIGLQSIAWLGPRASAAVPAIIRFLEVQTNKPQGTAVWALGEIGTNAVAARALAEQVFAAESNGNTKCTLAVALCKMDPGNALGLNYLTGLLDGTSADRYWAICTAGRLGENGKVLVPRLLPILGESSNASAAAYTLRQIGVSDKEIAAQLKERLLSKVSADDKRSAAFLILQHDPSDRDALSAMMQLVRVDGRYRLAAIERLGWAGPPAAEALPLLREILKNGTHPERLEARKAIWRIERSVK